MANANLARLPAFLSVPPAESRLEFDYSLAGRDRAVRGGAVFGPSEFAGAGISAGTTASFALSPRDLQYTAKGEFSGLDLAAAGRELAIEAIDNPLFTTVANGPFEVTWTGRDRNTVRVSARGTLRDSSVFQARIPSLDYELRLEGASLGAVARGSFRGFDPAVVTGSSAFWGSLDGYLDARLELPDVSAREALLENMSVAGQLSLGPSSFRGL
ncbi:MAG: hypothetical protein EHM13_06085, partial [Acidobacteria bacterium]